MGISTLSPEQTIGLGLVLFLVGRSLAHPRWHALFHRRNIGVLGSTAAVLPDDDGHFEGSFFQQFRKKKAVLPLLLLGGYLIFILQLMWSRLGVLLVPVSLYATTLTVTGFLGLLMAAENRYKQTKILALGTLLFALSDSMIAFDAFYFERPQFTYWIMATYIPAQFCIALFLAPAQGEK